MILPSYSRSREEIFIVENFQRGGWTIWENADSSIIYIFICWWTQTFKLLRKSSEYFSVQHNKLVISGVSWSKTPMSDLHE